MTAMVISVGEQSCGEKRVSICVVKERHVPKATQKPV